ncbi:MAG: M18 family aminopeptidase [Leptospiraceae bacterium]|nr:M18 family aminopeptidase [Leptospiraceae bacterium]
MSFELNDFLRFLDDSPTAEHCVFQISERLKAHQFTESVSELKTQQKPELRRLFLSFKGSILAVTFPKKVNSQTKIRIIAAHTDSPGLKLKTGNFQDQENIQFEIYGSPILYTWFDRDLGIAGEVYYQDGSKELVFCKQNLLHLSSLAIHLNRNVNSDGFRVSAQKMLRSFPENTSQLSDYLARFQNNTFSKKIIETDLFAVDLQPASLGGLNHETIHSDRLDNLAMVYCAHEAIKAVSTEKNTISVMAAFNHEEVGSESMQGAASARTMRDLQLLWKSIAHPDEPGDLSSVFSHPESILLSADMAHAWHPAHAEVYDDHNKVHLNAGPVIKYNAKQRYATSAAEAAYVRRLAEQLEIPLQTFYSHNDLPCGSTVGPILAANWGIPTIDMGNAMLGMHSIRETCGSHDLEMMSRLMHGFLLGN